MKSHCILLFALLFPFLTQAQKSFGLRFASDFNSFNRAQDYALVNGWFSTGVFGPFYRAYNKNGGYELGLNVNYKNATGKGFPNLPAVMEDFNKEDPAQNAGVTALELDFKVGPRFKAFNPRTGYTIGYRFQQLGFLEDDPNNADIKIQPLYVSLPFGATFDWPTRFGSVGFGAFYYVGLLNVMKKPDNYTSPGFYDGSKMRSLRFEITVTLDNRRQTD